MAEAKNDWILARAQYSQFEDPELFYENGYNVNNTELGDYEDYVNDNRIRQNDLFKDNRGAFSEAKFKRFYENEKQTYSMLAEKNFTYDWSDTAKFSPYSSLAIKEANVGDVSRYRPTLEFESNPFLTNEGYYGIDITQDSKFSMREIAQDNMVFNPATNEWSSTPNDRGFFGNLFGPTLVMATYDEDGYHYDEIAGMMVEHKKGEYKTGGSNNTVFYEESNGRDLHGKIVLNPLSTLTRDGSSYDQYNFLDNDDRHKSVAGTIAWTLSNVALAANPYTGPVYAWFNITKEVGDVLNKLLLIGADIADSESLRTFGNYMDGVYRRFDEEVSDYSQENMFTLENIGHTIAMVVLQAQEIRSIMDFANSGFKNPFSKDGSWLGWKSDLNQYLSNVEKEEALRRSKYISDYRKAIEGDRAIYSGYTVTDIKNAANARVFRDIEQLQKKYTHLGDLIQKAWMTGTVVKDTYFDARAEGASKGEAITIALAHAVSEWGIMNLGISEHILPELRASQSNWREAIRNILNIAKKEGDSGLTATGLKGFWNKLVEGIVYNRGPYAKGIIGAVSGGIAEGVEEVTEEFDIDLIKFFDYAIGQVTDGAYGGAFKNPFTTDDDLWSRYGMNALGGFIGGAINNFNVSYQDALKKRDTEFAKADAYRQIIRGIRNGQKNEILKELNKMKLGSDVLSNLQVSGMDNNAYFEISSERKGIKSQNQENHDRIADYLDYVESVLDSNNIKDDNSNLKDIIKADVRYSNFLNSLSATSYLDEYNKQVSEIVGLSTKIRETSEDLNKMPESDEAKRLQKLGEIKKLQNEMNEKVNKLHDMYDPQFDKNGKQVLSKAGKEYMKLAYWELVNGAGMFNRSILIPALAEKMTGKRWTQLTNKEKLDITNKIVENRKDKNNVDQIEDLRTTLKYAESVLGRYFQKGSDIYSCLNDAFTHTAYSAAKMAQIISGMQDIMLGDTNQKVETKIIDVYSYLANNGALNEKSDDGTSVADKLAQFFGYKNDQGEWGYYDIANNFVQKNTTWNEHLDDINQKFDKLQTAFAENRKKEEGKREDELAILQKIDPKIRAVYSSAKAGEKTLDIDAMRKYANFEALVAMYEGLKNCGIAMVNFNPMINTLLRSMEDFRNRYRDCDEVIGNWTTQLKALRSDDEILTYDVITSMAGVIQPDIDPSVNAKDMIENLKKLGNESIDNDVLGYFSEDANIEALDTLIEAITMMRNAIRLTAQNGPKTTKYDNISFSSMLNKWESEDPTSTKAPIAEIEYENALKIYSRLDAIYFEIMNLKKVLEEMGEGKFRADMQYDYDYQRRVLANVNEAFKRVKVFIEDKDTAAYDALMATLNNAAAADKCGNLSYLTRREYNEFKSAMCAVEQAIYSFFNNESTSKYLRKTVDDGKGNITVEYNIDFLSALAVDDPIEKQMSYGELSYRLNNGLSNNIELQSDDSTNFMHAKEVLGYIISKAVVDPLELTKRMSMLNLSGDYDVLMLNSQRESIYRNVAYMTDSTYIQAIADTINTVLANYTTEILSDPTNNNNGNIDDFFDFVSSNEALKSMFSSTYKEDKFNNTYKEIVTPSSTSVKEPVWPDDYGAVDPGPAGEYYVEWTDSDGVERRKFRPYNRHSREYKEWELKRDEYNRLLEQYNNDKAAYISSYVENPLYNLHKKVRDDISAILNDSTLDTEAKNAKILKYKQDPNSNYSVLRDYIYNVNSGCKLEYVCFDNMLMIEGSAGVGKSTAIVDVVARIMDMSNQKVAYIHGTHANAEKAVSKFVDIIGHGPEGQLDAYDKDEFLSKIFNPPTEDSAEIDLIPTFKKVKEINEKLEKLNEEKAEIDEIEEDDLTEEDKVRSSQLETEINELNSQADINEEIVKFLSGKNIQFGTKIIVPDIGEEYYTADTWKNFDDSSASRAITVGSLFTVENQIIQQADCYIRDAVNKIITTESDERRQFRKYTYQTRPTETAYDVIYIDEFTLMSDIDIESIREYYKQSGVKQPKIVLLGDLNQNSIIGDMESRYVKYSAHVSRNVFVTAPKMTLSFRANTIQKRLNNNYISRWINNFKSKINQTFQPEAEVTMDSLSDFRNNTDPLNFHYFINDTNTAFAGDYVCCSEDKTVEGLSDEDKSVMKQAVTAMLNDIQAGGSTDKIQVAERNNRSHLLRDFLVDEFGLDVVDSYMEFTTSKDVQGSEADYYIAHISDNAAYGSNQESIRDRCNVMLNTLNTITTRAKKGSFVIKDSKVAKTSMKGVAGEVVIDWSNTIRNIRDKASMNDNLTPSIISKYKRDQATTFMECLKKMTEISATPSTESVALSPEAPAPLIPQAYLFESGDLLFSNEEFSMSDPNIVTDFQNGDDAGYAESVGTDGGNTTIKTHTINIQANKNDKHFSEIMQNMTTAYKNDMVYDVFALTRHFANAATYSQDDCDKANKVKQYILNNRISEAAKLLQISEDKIRFIFKQSKYSIDNANNHKFTETVTGKNNTTAQKTIDPDHVGSSGLYARIEIDGKHIDVLMAAVPTPQTLMARLYAMSDLPDNAKFQNANVWYGKCKLQKGMSIQQRFDEIATFKKDIDDIFNNNPTDKIFGNSSIKNQVDFIFNTYYGSIKQRSPQNPNIVPAGLYYFGKDPGYCTLDKSMVSNWMQKSKQTVITTSRNLFYDANSATAQEAYAYNKELGISLDEFRKQNPSYVLSDPFAVTSQTKLNYKEGVQDAQMGAMYVLASTNPAYTQSDLNEMASYGVFKPDVCALPIVAPKVKPSFYLRSINKENDERVDYGSNASSVFLLKRLFESIIYNTPNKGNAIKALKQFKVFSDLNDREIEQIFTLTQDSSGANVIEFGDTINRQTDREIKELKNIYGPNGEFPAFDSFDVANIVYYFLKGDTENKREFLREGGLWSEFNGTVMQMVKDTNYDSVLTSIDSILGDKNWLTVSTKAFDKKVSINEERTGKIPAAIASNFRDFSLLQIIRTPQIYIDYNSISTASKSLTKTKKQGGSHIGTTEEFLGDLAVMQGKQPNYEATHRNGISKITDYLVSFRNNSTSQTAYNSRFISHDGNTFNAYLCINGLYVKLSKAANPSSIWYVDPLVSNSSIASDINSVLAVFNDLYGNLSGADINNYNNETRLNLYGIINADIHSQYNGLSQAEFNKIATSATNGTLIPTTGDRDISTNELAVIFANSKEKVEDKKQLNLFFNRQFSRVLDRHNISFKISDNKELFNSNRSLDSTKPHSYYDPKTRTVCFDIRHLIGDNVKNGTSAYVIAHEITHAIIDETIEAYRANPNDPRITGNDKLRQSLEGLEGIYNHIKANTIFNSGYFTDITSSFNEFCAKLIRPAVLDDVVKFLVDNNISCARIDGFNIAKYDSNNTNNTKQAVLSCLNCISDTVLGNTGAINPPSQKNDSSSIDIFKSLFSGCDAKNHNINILSEEDVVAEAKFLHQRIKSIDLDDLFENQEAIDAFVNFRDIQEDQISIDSFKSLITSIKQSNLTRQEFLDSGDNIFDKFVENIIGNRCDF